MVSKIDFCSLKQTCIKIHEIYGYTFKRRCVNLPRQEPTEVQISKLKLKLYRKNKKCTCILVIALNLKILCMRFLTAQLNRTMTEKIIDMKDT